MLKKLAVNKTLLNIVSNGIYQVLILGIPFFTIPYISRVLGVELLGIYSKVNSLAIFVSVFSLISLSQFGVREVATSNNKSATFSKLYTLQLLASIFVLSIYVLYFSFIYKGNLKEYYLLEIPFLIAAIFDISWFFIGIGSMTRVVIRNSFVKIFMIICIFVFVKNNQDLWIYILINGVGFTISNICFFVSLKKHNIKFEFKYDRTLLKVAIFLLPTQISIAIILQLSTSLVAGISGNSQASFFDQSQKLVRMVLGIVTSVNTVLMPLMASIDLKIDSKKFEKYLIMSLNISSYIAFGICAVLIGNSVNFVPWFFGSDFQDMIPVFQAASLLLVVLPISGVIGNQLLIAKGHYKIYSYTIYIGALINIIVVSILSFLWGAFGGIIGIILSELIIVLLRIFIVRNELPLKKVFSELPIILFAMIITILISLFIPKLKINILLSLIINTVTTVLSYFVILVMFSSTLKSFVKQYITYNK